MKLFKLFTSFQISLLLIIPALSCKDHADSIKVENWKILYEPHSGIDSIPNNGNWKPIDIPFLLKLSNRASRDFNFIWLKGVFNISGDPSKYSGISTGKVIFADKVYINNRLIGYQPVTKISWSPLPRNYLIPDGTLKTGENIIYVQLGIYDRFEGGILNCVLIQDENNFYHTQFIDNLIYTFLPWGSVIIFAGFLISLIIIYLWNRKEKLPLYAAFGLASYIFYKLSSLLDNRLFSYEIYLVFSISIIPLFSISFILFLQSLYKIYFSNYNKIIIMIFFIFIGVMYLLRNTVYNYQTAFILTNIILVITISYLVFLIYRLKSINPDRFLLRTIILMFVIVNTIMIFEFYSVYLGGYYSNIIATMSPMIFLIISAVLYSREIIKKRLELEALYNKFKSVKECPKEPAITESAEEKLKRVISFIDENFISDISKEGLAAASGINPTYMGTLFKAYTGKAIHEYIHTLRIEEAVKLLKSGNKKIIDIAYSLGYDNTVTFNRIFKKITGRTPSDYKNNG